MGPEFWKQDKASKLKKCSEFHSDSCDITATDGCCAVIPCDYCIRFDGTYGTEHAIAGFDTDGWYGTINGWPFVAYWARNYSTNECEFIVTVNGTEVYRNDCYGGQSCRDSSDAVDITIGTESGLLTWTKFDPRPLHYVIDPDTNCRTWFCGTCECSCDCLCVTITRAYSFEQCTGEICDTAYTDCDGPVWEGTIECEWGPYVLSLALAQDSYGNCVIRANVDGVDLGDFAVSGCSDMSATITTGDGTTIDVRCKICDCTVLPQNCCAPRCAPLEADTISGTNIPGECSNPLPECLTVDLTATPDWGTTTCFNGSGEICYRTPLSYEPGVNCWQGDVTGTCTDCNGVSFAWRVSVTLCCSDSGRWSVSAAAGSPCVGLLAEEFDSFSCDPMRVTGCFVNRIVGCFTGCLDDVTVTDAPEYTLCFDIYETP